jgi:hypothetical protein
MREILIFMKIQRNKRTGIWCSVCGYLSEGRSLIKHHTVMYRGVEIQLHAFLTSKLGGDELSASRPGCFTPGEIALGTHWIRGWVGPRTSLYGV